VSHDLTQRIFDYLSTEKRHHINDTEKAHMDTIIRSYFFADELRFRANGAIASARQESAENGFPLADDRALTIVIEEAVKLYGEQR
jgi:hypothetical protein